VQAYDYTKNLFTASEQATVASYFRSAATYWYSRVHYHLTASRWPNYDNFTKDSDYLALNTSNGVVAPLYDGGPSGRAYHTIYANSLASAMIPVGLIVVLLNDTALKTAAARYVKEQVMFGFYPQGAGIDFTRSNDAPIVAARGWQYVSAQVSSAVMIADAFARAGDPSLYRYTSTFGLDESAGADQLSGGTPKSILNTVLWHEAYMDLTINRTYGGTTIRPTTASIHELRYAPIANRFYKNARSKSMYMRTASNTFSYPANPQGGAQEWGGN
jgi:hypothetical protein